MRKLYISDFTNKRAWVIRNYSDRWIKRYDNGHLVSIGLVVDEDFPQKTVDNWVSQGFAEPCDYTEAIHLGCQSSCIRRGGKQCRW